MDMSTKPRYTTSLEDFASSGESTTITYHKMSFVEKIGSIEFPLFNVIDDYIDDLIAVSEETELSAALQHEYKYRPKLMADKLYGNGELYYILLLINGICNIKEFTLEGKIRLIKKDILLGYLQNIYRSEKNQIEEFNEKDSNG